MSQEQAPRPEERNQSADEMLDRILDELADTGVDQRLMQRLLAFWQQLFRTYRPTKPRRQRQPRREAMALALSSALSLVAVLLTIRFIAVPPAAPSHAPRPAPDAPMAPAATEAPPASASIASSRPRASEEPSPRPSPVTSRRATSADAVAARWSSLVHATRQRQRVSRQAQARTSAALPGQDNPERVALFLRRAARTGRLHAALELLVQQPRSDSQWQRLAEVVSHVSSHAARRRLLTIRARATYAPLVAASLLTDGSAANVRAVLRWWVGSRQQEREKALRWTASVPLETLARMASQPIGRPACGLLLEWARESDRAEQLVALARRKPQFAQLAAACLAAAGHYELVAQVAWRGRPSTQANP